MRKPQFNETDFLARLPRLGYFVDIGAAGEYSNTEVLQSRGWVGWNLDKEHGQFITAENVNQYLREVPDPFDFLSIDIDGNDYWIWSAIEKSPRWSVLSSIQARPRQV